MSTALRFRKACIPCRAKKLRCNAHVVGIPCDRCTYSGDTSNCALSPRQPRTRKQVAIEQSLSQSSPSHPSTTAVGGAQSGARAQSQNTSVSDEVANSHGPQGSTASEGGEADTQIALQLCLEIATGRKILTATDVLDSPTPAQQIIEYRRPVDSVTILGEVIGNHRGKRPIRLVFNDNDASVSLGSSISNDQNFIARASATAGLNDGAVRFLTSERAFHLPSRNICDQLLKLYFLHGDPNTPVLDRVEFTKVYLNGQVSIFLMQAILASAIPFAPVELITEAGFPDRFTAQRTFWSRATYLYNFGCEKNQLRLLQGSMILTTAVTTYGSQRDVNYWLHNAIRIATGMGLYRSDITTSMDTKMSQLCRRIWWAIESQEALFWIIGLKSSRLRFDEQDALPLTIDDWDEDLIPDDGLRIISPIPSTKKEYIIQLYRLTTIASVIMSKLERFDAPSDEVALLESIPNWRHELPSNLQIHSVRKWSASNVCLLILMAVSYRTESILYRMLRQHYSDKDETKFKEMSANLYGAMFELESIIARVVAYDLVQSTTLLFVNCVSTSIALRIEIALDPISPSTQSTISPISLQSGLSFLRKAQLYWQTAQASLRLLEWVIQRKNLVVVGQEFRSERFPVPVSPDHQDPSPSGIQRANRNEPAPGFLHDFEEGHFPRMSFELDLFDRFPELGEDLLSWMHSES